MPSAELPGWLLWMLPGLFLLHDAEEALLLPSWLRSNRDALSGRFPRTAGWLYAHMGSESPGQFACMAAQELVLLLAVTAYARWGGHYAPWVALFSAFTLHLPVHLAQGIAVGGYIPSVVTSLVCLPLCGWGYATVVSSRLFSGCELLVCAVAGCVVAALNLGLLHRLAAARRRKAG